MLSRRTLLGSAAGLCTYALLAEAGTTGAARCLPVRRWVERHDELARGLASGSVSATEWHRAANALAAEVDPGQLAAELRHARMRAAGEPFGHDPRKRFVQFLDEDGNPRRLAYGVAIFDFDARSVITPHAHRHMASAHMVVEGRLRVRTFDRVGDEQGALRIRPTGDVVAQAGHAAAMTDARDNVHWFSARSERAMTIDVILDGLDAGQPRYLIQPVDPLGGAQLGDGTIRAPLLSFGESMARYDVAA
jgi:hypothetical protein